MAVAAGVVIVVVSDDPLSAVIDVIWVAAVVGQQHQFKAQGPPERREPARVRSGMRVHCAGFASASTQRISGEGPAYGSLPRRALSLCAGF